jgi:hypothetical protein
VNKAPTKREDHLVVRDRIELSTFRFSGWRRAREAVTCYLDVGILSLAGRRRKCRTI